MKAGAGELVAVSTLSARDLGRGRIGLTRKFVSGMEEFCRRWPGPVRVLMDRSASDDNLDQVDYAAADVPFAFDWRSPTDSGLVQQITSAGLVTSGLYYRDVALTPLCWQMGTPLVYTSEYSLKTRLQIVVAQTRNPILRARRALWNWNVERGYVAAVRGASGVQCNGTPTFQAYGGLGVPSLLYFDTRVRESMVIREGTLSSRLKHVLDPRQPIRLCFSGRLNAIKGAEHLTAVAAALRNRGVNFTMDVCGAGNSEPEMMREITRLNLGSAVRLRGVLDFETQLIPFVSESVDLFVCCHRQGDPSCTYLETMSCGVPIAGYDNEAFAGVACASGVGWTTRMNRPEELADAIARVADDRNTLALASKKAREFSLKHTFERTMDSRVEHLLSCLAGARKRQGTDRRSTMTQVVDG